MVTARDRILDAAEDLIAAGHAPPSLDAVAAAAGVSKGGLLYHFDKQSLLQALIVRAVQQADARLTEAAGAGGLAQAWLRLSVPDDTQQRLYRAMLSMLRLTSRGELDLPAELTEADRRWQGLLAAELGDPVRARLVRVVGDGLLLAALTGPAPAPREVEELIAALGLPGATVGDPS